MEIFPDIKHDDRVQLNEKIRFDFSSIFVTRPNTLADVKRIEFKPTPSASFFTVHDSTIPAQKLDPKDWNFDWNYLDKTDAVSNLMTVTVRVTGSDDIARTLTSQVLLMTAAEDNLFSSDNDLVNHEFEILKYIPAGRSTWNYIHRRAQSRILSYLFEKGYRNKDGTPYTKAQVIETYDVKEWSTFMALKLIFGTVLNSQNDVFKQKSAFYENLEGRANKTNLRIDSNSDGEITEADDMLDLNGPVMVRR